MSSWQWWDEPAPPARTGRGHRNTPSQQNREEARRLRAEKEEWLKEKKAFQMEQEAWQAEKETFERQIESLQSEVEDLKQSSHAACWELADAEAEVVTCRKRVGEALEQNDKLLKMNRHLLTLNQQLHGRLGVMLQQDGRKGQDEV